MIVDQPATKPNQKSHNYNQYQSQGYKNAVIIISNSGIVQMGGHTYMLQHMQTELSTEYYW